MTYFTETSNFFMKILSSSESTLGNTDLESRLTGFKNKKARVEIIVFMVCCKLGT